VAETEGLSIHAIDPLSAVAGTQRKRQRLRRMTRLYVDFHIRSTARQGVAFPHRDGVKFLSSHGRRTGN